MDDQIAHQHRYLEPILIFCSPRSCSTVLCAMLGMHAQLYGFPELNLFLTDKLGELELLANSAHPKAVSYWAGLLRAIAELEFGGQSSDGIQTAQKWISARRSWTTKRTLRYLLAAVSPRIGVDKSPRTCLSTQSIGRAVEAFPKARIVHLSRHPIASILSLLRSHSLAAPTAAEWDLAPVAEFYAELWLRSQQSILATLEHRDPRLSIRMRAEDLLTDPVFHLTRLSQWLNLSSDADSIAPMVHPEHSPYACLPPGDLIGDGDPGFQRSPFLRQYNQNRSELRLHNEWRFDAALRSQLDRVSQTLGYPAL